MTHYRHLKSVGIALVFAVMPALAFASSITTAPVSTTQLAAQQRKLEAYARRYGATVSPLKIHIKQTLDASATSGTATGNGLAPNIKKAGPSSCTATATVSIPGGTGITLSATAPTCTQAIHMVVQAVENYVSGNG